MVWFPCEVYSILFLDLSSGKINNGMKNESTIIHILKLFTTRTHFMRFLAVMILFPVIIMVLKGMTVPNEMWMTVGAVIGFYYKSHKDD
jgi:hypothetical protein